MEKKSIKAVIFDCDGTLLDTEKIHTRAHVELTGRPLDWDFKVQMMGKQVHEAAAMTIEREHLNVSVEEFSRQFHETIDKFWEEGVDLMPGVERVIHTLQEKRIPMAIATASYKDSFMKKTKSHPNLLKVMDHCVTGDEVSRGKPEPDLFLAVLAKWPNIKPEETLVFEDSPLGIAAANKAGMCAIYIPDPHLNNPDILQSYGAKPDLTLNSLNEFDFSLFSWT